MAYDIAYFNAAGVLVGTMRDVQRDIDACEVQAQKFMLQIHDVEKAVITGPGAYGTDTERHIRRATEWQKLNG